MSGFFKGWFRRPVTQSSFAPTTSAPPIPTYQWFGVVTTDDLEQGDIFEDCPTFQPPENINAERATIRWEERDLILMSQSCDLVKGREKANQFQACLCEVWRRSEFRSNHPLSSADNLEKVRKGQMPRYHMIAASAISGFERELRIVDLQQIYSLPIEFLRRRAANGKRLRLLPPYREHLSQSFARVFMRVGLPIDIPPIKK
jgi:hypothetical protein